MTRIYHFIVTLLLLSLTTACSTTGSAVDPRKLVFAPLEFSIPKTERTTLSNGITIQMLENHELPLVNMTAYIDTGNIYEPGDMTGLASITGALIRSGGTESIPPDRLDAELEFMASGIESSISEEVGNISMQTLNRNLDRTLELFAEVLTKPGFDEGRLKIIKMNTVEAIRRQNDDPKGIAERELRRAIYGNHPLSRVATMESVNRITRGDIIAYYRKYHRPQKMILAVSGDFNSKELKAKLEKLLGSWNPAGEIPPPVPQPGGAQTGQKILFARKPVSQTVIRMGHLGLEKNNPDQYAIRVLDYILGGGFTSRLTQEIRSNQGLAYSAGSRFDIGRRFPGTFTAETETKSASTARAIGLMRSIISGMTQKEVTDEELQLAKEALINSFIFGFSRADYIVNQRARLEFFSYPEGYLENFRSNIARVSKEDILRVARKYLHPDAMTIMVVGNDKKFDKPLDTLGEVREITLETGK